MKTSKRAKSLRHNQTWAEKMLWKRLRNRKICGFKFRRQYSEGPYILDFYCPELGYAIELDGREHGETGRQTRDLHRDGYLAQQGIFVKRVWNFQLRENEHGVIDGIRIDLEKRARKIPSP
jgi:very-short-patch-repair endonuclease